MLRSPRQLEQVLGEKLNTARQTHLKRNAVGAQYSKDEAEKRGEREAKAGGASAHTASPDSSTTPRAGLRAGCQGGEGTKCSVDGGHSHVVKGKNHHLPQ